MLCVGLWGTYIYVYSGLWLNLTQCVHCLQNADADVEKMILGNKCDLSDSQVVSKERGQSLADEHGIKFMEISAKASTNVEEVSILSLHFCRVLNVFHRLS